MQAMRCRDRIEQLAAYFFGRSTVQQAFAAPGVGAAGSAKSPGPLDHRLHCLDRLDRIRDDQQRRCLLKGKTLSHRCGTQTILPSLLRPPSLLSLLPRMAIAQLRHALEALGYASCSIHETVLHPGEDRARVLAFLVGKLIAPACLEDVLTKLTSVDEAAAACLAPDEVQAHSEPC